MGIDASETVTALRYGNTNTCFIRGTQGGLLIDTDLAGTLSAFFKAIKAAGIGLQEISYLMVTHCHPDHIGLAGELQALGVKLLLWDVQADAAHFADEIFARERGLRYRPVDDAAAIRLRAADSRSFLQTLGISGEVLHTPSHSADSVSLILDSGVCFVGDLEPLSYLKAYENNPQLQEDWQQILRFAPKRICHAHANTVDLAKESGAQKQANGHRKDEKLL